MEPIELIHGYATREQQREALSLGLAESTVAYLFLALTPLQTILLLASHSQVGYGLPESFVLYPGIDFGSRDVPVTECPLHQTEIASLAEEPHGKGVTLMPSSA